MVQTNGPFLTLEQAENLGVLDTIEGIESQGADHPLKAVRYVDSPKKVKPGEHGMADIANELKDTFSKVVNAPVKAVSDAVDTVKKYTGFGPKPTVESQPDKPDAGWHSDMVNKANASFKNKPTAPAPAKKPSYKHGTDFVPETGDAKLHKGEAVLKKEDADKYREAKMHGTMEDLRESLGGDHHKPKKEIHEIKTRKAKSGGFIHTHTPTHPAHHPDEEHVSKDMAALHDHMEDAFGTPNPGEAEADAGQSGIPTGAGAGAGAPQGGTPAGGPPSPVMG